VDILEGEDDIDYECILIEPPDVSVDTDVDTAEEDQGGRLDDLGDRQLAANATIVVLDGRRLAKDADLEIKLPHRPTQCSSPAEQDAEPLEFPVPTFDEYENLTPVQFFELFFDNEVQALLVAQSNAYALFKGFPDLNLTVDELKCFMGILLISSLVFSSRRAFYWDKGLTRLPIVVEAMTKERFEEILRSIHCADNTQPNKDDKFYKIQHFLKHFKPTSNYLSYDYHKIDYYGKHVCFQRVRLMNKSYGYPKINIEFGYEAMCLNEKDGYLVNFELFQGKSKTNAGAENADTPTTQLERMICDIPSEVRQHPFRIYRFHLHTRDGTRYEDTKFSVTESVGPDQTKVVKVEKNEEGPIIFKYKEPPSSTTSMSKKFDDYSIQIRTNKWWWMIFTWLIDVSVHNARLLMVKRGTKIGYSKFYEKIVEHYLNTYKNPPSRENVVPADVRAHA